MSACSGFVSWCCSRLDARLVLLVRCCLLRSTAGIVGCWLSVVLAWPGLNSAGACSPPCWGVPCLCVPPPLVGRAVLLRGPPFAGACCVGGRLLRWWCLVWVVVICRVDCGCSCLVGLAGVGAVMVRAPPPPCWGVSCLCVAPPLVGSAVSACSGFGSWCCSRLDARLDLLVRCCLRRRTAGIVGCWLSVFFAWPGLVLCWCVPPPPLVGRAALGCGPLLGGARCVGACPPSCWGVLCWCPPAAMVVFGLACRRLLGGLWLWLCCWLDRGWCCAGVCPPPPHCWGVPCLCVAPALVGPAVSACSGFGSWCCSRLDARLVLLVRCCLRRRTAGVVGCLLPVVFAWPGSVLLWCVPPPLLGRAVLLLGFPLGRACCVGVFGFWFVVL